jgi:hypothetical protein
MKGQTIKILLAVLVVINIIDGDFQNPSALDIIKFILLAVCLILSFVKGHENESERNQNK